MGKKRTRHISGDLALIDLVDNNITYNFNIINIYNHQTAAYFTKLDIFSIKKKSNVGDLLI